MPFLETCKLLYRYLIPKCGKESRLSPCNNRSAGIDPALSKPRRDAFDPQDTSARTSARPTCAAFPWRAARYFAAGLRVGFRGERSRGISPLSSPLPVDAPSDKHHTTVGNRGSSPFGFRNAAPHPLRRRSWSDTGIADTRNDTSYPRP